MKKIAPVSRLLARKTREAHILRDELTAERIRVLALEARLGVATHELERLARDYAAKRGEFEDALAECVSLRRINAVLMQSAPSDLRELGEAG